MHMLSVPARWVGVQSAPAWCSAGRCARGIVCRSRPRPLPHGAQCRSRSLQRGPSTPGCTCQHVHALTACPPWSGRQVRHAGAPETWDYRSCHCGNSRLEQAVKCRALVCPQRAAAPVSTKLLDELLQLLLGVDVDAARVQRASQIGRVSSVRDTRDLRRREGDNLHGHTQVL